MPMIVPSRQTIGQQRAASAASTNSVQPPNDVYALMAAAQMHSEGRLLAPTGGVEDKLNSIPESAQAPVRTR